MKISQFEVDTLISISFVDTIYSYTYAWFDGVHFAPVFTIDSVINIVAGNPTTYYSVFHLTSETAGISVVQYPKTVAVAFPNPNDGQFTLSYHLTTPTAILQIKDITGRLVHSETLSESFGNAIINCKSFNETASGGVYMWEIISNNEVQGQGKISVK